jgi:hypothetical protein
MEVRKQNRALVIGARGVFGAMTVDAFTAAGWDVRMGVRRPQPGQVDIDLDRPELVAAALDEHELVVNTVPHPELLAERHVLEHGGTLINTSSLPAAAGRSLRAVAGGARGRVLMNAGIAPGVTALVAADLLRLHPKAQELEIVFTHSVRSAAGPASADFFYRGLTAVTRHRTALVPLPSPFGERVCLGFSENESGWLGGLAEGRAVRLYVCIAEPPVHEHLLELNRAGAMHTLPPPPADTPRPPGDGSAGDEPVAHWIAAIRGGRRLGARTIECRGDFLHAARSTVVFADALLAGQPEGGCFDPEELWTLGSLEPELRAAGIAVVSHPAHAVQR